LVAIQYINQCYSTRGEHLYLEEKKLRLTLASMTRFLKALKLENDTCQSMNGEDPLHWQGMWQGGRKECVGAT